MHSNWITFHALVNQSNFPLLSVVSSFFPTHLNCLLLSFNDVQNAQRCTKWLAFTAGCPNRLDHIFVSASVMGVDYSTLRSPINSENPLALQGVDVSKSAAFLTQVYKKNKICRMFYDNRLNLDDFLNQTLLLANL